MKTGRKKKFLKLIAEIPVITAVCDKVGISRETYYRWRKKDSDFSKAVAVSMNQGVESINDIAESVVINDIRANKNVGTSKWWLAAHKKEYFKPRPKNIHIHTNEKIRENVIRFVDCSKEETKKKKDPK